LLEDGEKGSHETAIESFQRIASTKHPSVIAKNTSSDSVLIRVSDNDRTALLGWMLGASFPSKVWPTKTTLALKRRAAPKQVRILSEILHPFFLSSIRMLGVYRKLQIIFSAITKDNRKILLLESLIWCFAKSSHLFG